jgi:hypothetical protein
VPLGLVGVPTAVPVLYYVARLGEVGDDGVRAAFGDVERSGDVAQTHPGVAGDAEKGRAWLVKKLQFATPLLPHFWAGIAGVRCGVRLVATVGASAESVVRCLNIFSSSAVSRAWRSVR